MKKKGFTLIELLAVIIILAIIALIATPIILNVIDDARKSAGLSESEMIMSGINNYCAASKIKNQLDETEDICADGVTIDDVSQMVNLGNAEVLEIEYLEDNLIWLKVKSNNNIYSLENRKMVLGDKERPEYPISLVTLLLKQYKEGATVGLVKDSGNENIYYYKGTNNEVNNNYLWYGGHHWRIIEIDKENNTVLLISQQPLTAIQPSSEVWQTREEYENSYINSWLNEYFYNSLDSSIKNNIKDNTFNVGIYTDVDEITTNQKIGLLDDEQYNRANGHNSYLNITDYWWLGNRYDSSSIRNGYSPDNIRSDTPLSSFGVRSVIKISDIIITEGNGTLTSNYKTADEATNTSNVQVGEYINVPYNGSDNACGSDNKCTFRVVSKDNESIKVILNGLLPTTSIWANDTSDNITDKDLIYTNVLDDFIKKIDDEYITVGTYGVGQYENKSSYTVPWQTTIAVKVGLPTVGEMFSGNDIDIATTNKKVFVDENTIENPATSSYYWTMNRYASSAVRTIYANGGLFAYAPTETYGVRPVIFLKNNLNFVSGNGTAQSPYEL